ncbi:MAG TPA: 3-deoxy-7-phosphoheptulonate synthase, partial [Polyangiaceae bacterium]|nr:3-deoxy-7-phosphoheptulonate synthase [Polyangiaceae bacterium]
MLPDERFVVDSPRASRQWSTLSWQTKTDTSRITYPNEKHADEVLLAQSILPPLVSASEVEQLKALIAEAQNGRRFLLQAGDCAERFADCEFDSVRSKLRTLRDLAALLSEKGHTPIGVGRIAGQYAKPRSSPLEIRDGVALPSYFGDLYNGIEFSVASRQLDPQRMQRGYQCASKTLEAMRVASEQEPDLRVFTSHEGLNLRYESSLTRFVDGYDGYYDLSTHLPWIGKRTCALDGAHVEFFRGIRNAVAVKIGPRSTPAEVLELVDTLNPRDEPGKLVLVSRMGAEHIEKVLPGLVRAVKHARKRVLWISDPMHGNTMTTASGYKTRHVEQIAREVALAFRIHAACEVPLGGIHLEVAHDAVTECVGE